MNTVELTSSSSILTTESEEKLTTFYSNYACATLYPDIFGMSVLQRVANLKSGPFRTILRLLTRRLSLEQAQKLLEYRHAAKLELLADDVNVVLEAYACTDANMALGFFLTRIHQQTKYNDLTNHTDTNTDDEKNYLAEAMHVLRTHDAGPLPTLDFVCEQRTSEWHTLSITERDKMAEESTKREIQVQPIWLKRIDDIMHANNVTKDKVDNVDNEARTSLLPPSTKRPRIASMPLQEISTHTADESIESTTNVNNDNFSRIRKYLTTTLDLDTPNSKWNREHAQARLKGARTLFETMHKTSLGVEPNSRSYAMMIATALNASDGEYAGKVLSHMLASGLTSLETLVFFFQPRFLFRLWETGALSVIGITTKQQFEDLFTAPLLSHKWCFMAAIHQAAKGDQFGSKHGGVLVNCGIGIEDTHKGKRGKNIAGGEVIALHHLYTLPTSTRKLLAVGRNHRFGIPKSQHLRVMHSEVHCLVQLPRSDNEIVSSHAMNSEVYVVELDKYGIGYEEGVPCPMCNAGLCQCGVRVAYFSAHNGLRTLHFAYRPTLRCNSYEDALTRIYPQPTTKCPDTPIDDYIQLGTESFWKLFASTDMSKSTIDDEIAKKSMK